MDTAPQLLHCGINSLRWPLSSSKVGDGQRRDRHRTSPSLSRAQRPSVVAVATGPKPRNSLASSPATSREPPNGSTNGTKNRFGSVTDDIKRVRAQMEEDEQLSSLMRGLRGQNLPDSQFADENIKLRLVEPQSGLIFCGSSTLSGETTTMESDE